VESARRPEPNVDVNRGEDTKSTEALKNQKHYIVTRFEQVKNLPVGP
jgi:hypothetical protein